MVNMDNRRLSLSVSMMVKIEQAPLTPYIVETKSYYDVTTRTLLCSVWLKDTMIGKLKLCQFTYLK